MSVNAACICARHFDSNFNEWPRRGSGVRDDSAEAGASQSERFSDIGAARRGLGAVCCPTAV